METVKEKIVTALTITAISLQGYFMYETFMLLIVALGAFAFNKKDLKTSIRFISSVVAPLLFMFIHINQLVDASLSGSVWKISAVFTTLIVVFFIHYQGVKMEFNTKN